MLNTCVCMRQGERPTLGLSNQVKLWSFRPFRPCIFFSTALPTGHRTVLPACSTSQLRPAPPSPCPPKTASSRQPSTTWVELLSVGPGATTTASGGL